MKRYRETTGTFDPKLFPEAAKAIRGECREAKVKCSRRDATLVVRILLQVVHDARSEPLYCGMGRLRMLDEAEATRTEKIFEVFMRPNITNPIKESAHGLCNQQLFASKGFKRVVRHGRTHLQALVPDLALESKPPVLLVLK